MSAPERRSESISGNFRNNPQEEAQYGLTDGVTIVVERAHPETGDVTVLWSGSPKEFKRRRKYLETAVVSAVVTSSDDQERRIPLNVSQSFAAKKS